MTNVATETRKKASIENYHDTAPSSVGDQMQANALKQKYAAALHRPTAVGSTYNCHGLTFASRRTQIWKTSEIRKILADDGYVRIPSQEDVLPGDTVLYVDESGDIEHSGIVLQKENTGLLPIVRVLSKWGSAHEVVHALMDCPYSLRSIEYYRVTS
ncbi:MAG: hypothetical protein ACREEY_17505 [Brevundimonas sp.]